MRSRAALARDVALVVLFASSLAFLVADQAFDLPSSQLHDFRVSFAWAFLTQMAVGALATYELAAPLRHAGAPPGDLAAAAAAAAAHRLPRRLSGTVFILFSFAAAVVVWRVKTEYEVLDLEIAGAAIGLAFALLAALLTYARASSASADVLARLGPRGEFAHHGSVRRKILSLCLGLDTVALLLFAGAGYARYRVNVDEEYVAAAQRAQASAVAAAGARSDFDLAVQVWLATEAPVALLDAQGAIRARFGAPDAPLTAVRGEPPVRRVRTGGWLVRTAIPGGGAVVGWVSERPLRDRRNAFGWALFRVGLAVYAAAGILAFLSANAITRPFRALGRAADRIASGDLTASPPSLSRDEMGQLAADFRRMTTGLKGLVRDVKEASQGVSVGAHEAGDIGERVRAGALDQHAGVIALEGAVEAMEGSMGLVARGVDGLSDYVSSTTVSNDDLAVATEEVRRRGQGLERAMTAALEDIERLAAAGREADATLAALEALADHAAGTVAASQASLAGLTRAAGEVETNGTAVDASAAQAGAVVRETMQGIEALRTAVGDAHRRVSALGRRSDDVDQVVDFIAEVAGRTNLLSLNASIIAAQAGEHGRAFAVVADQIRALAAQIARSTTSIGDIIRAVRDDVEATAALIDRGDALAAAGVELARKSCDALGAVQRSARSGSEAAATIRAAVEAHGESAREVSRLVGSVTEGSHAVSGAVKLVGRSVAAAGGVTRTVSALAEQLARALEEQAQHGRRQRESLARVEQMLADIARAVRNHGGATGRVRDTLRGLSAATGNHEAAVQGLASVADGLRARARALAERVDRFKV